MARPTMKSIRVAAVWLLWSAGIAGLVRAALSSPIGWQWVMEVAGGIAFGAVGLIIGLKAPEKATGWLFLLIPPFMAADLAAFAQEFAVLMMLACVSGVVLTFPSGTLPTQRWRWVGVGLSMLVVVSTVYVLFDLVAGVHLPGSDLLGAVFFIAISAVIGAAVIRIINEYRRSRGDVRQQLKWLAWILLVGGILLLASMLPFAATRELNNVAGLVLLVGAPLAVGVAVTRYHLYEIDRIISRTLSYSIVLAVLAGAFVALVTAISSRFSGSFAVAASTLAVAALFNPLRRRVQAGMERRFNRSKYDHERVAEQFAASLRDRVDLEQLMEGWVEVVNETMQPRAISVWTKAS